MPVQGCNLPFYEHMPNLANNTEEGGPHRPWVLGMLSYEGVKLRKKGTLHVSDSSSVHHQEFSLYTQQWYMLYRFDDSLRAESGRMYKLQSSVL